MYQTVVDNDDDFVQAPTRRSWWCYGDDGELDSFVALEREEEEELASGGVLFCV